MIETLLELLPVIAVVGGSIGAVGVFLLAIPFQRWELEYRGHKIEIVNYTFREMVWLDGSKVANSRTGGDYFSHAEHTIEIDGHSLRIWIGLDGMAVRCRVDNGHQVIFNSSAGSPPELTDPLPVTTGSEPEDPRLAAARVLLAEVASVDPTAATDLTQALERVLAADRQARTAAEAHTALGGNGEETKQLLDRRADDVQQVLKTLRTLHVRIAQDDDDSAEALSTAREALARLDAAREVSQDERADARKRAAQRIRS
jgi:hypothetical protein